MEIKQFAKYVFWHFGNLAFKTNRGFIDSVNHHHQSYLQTIIFSFNEESSFSFGIISVLLLCFGPCPPLPSVPGSQGPDGAQAWTDAPDIPVQKPSVRQKGILPSVLISLNSHSGYKVVGRTGQA